MTQQAVQASAVPTDEDFGFFGGEGEVARLMDWLQHKGPRLEGGCCPRCGGEPRRLELTWACAACGLRGLLEQACCSHCRLREQAWEMAPLVAYTPMRAPSSHG